MTRGEIMMGLSAAMTLQNVTGGGGRPDSVFAVAIKYWLQGGSGPYIVISSDGTIQITKQGTWNIDYCFGTMIPKTAKRLIIHMSAEDTSSTYNKVVIFRYRSDYVAEEPTGLTRNVIAFVTNDEMTVSDLMAQAHVISLSLTQNNRLSEQDVVLDVSFIHDDFYLELFTANQVLHLYSIGIEY